MDIATLGAFAAASMVLLVIPGPTALLIVAYAITQGRRVAVATAAGVALGDLVAMSASLAGLGAMMLASATLFAAVKWIGAAYLVWMGIGLWRSARRHAALARAGGRDAALAGQGETLAAGRVFRHAFVVTALNPKSIAFFIAFVPQFIDPAAAYAPQAALLTAVFVALAAGNALFYALLADGAGTRLRRPAVRAWIERAGGTALFAMAGATATLRHG
ncbi:MAG: LysE family translocator [Pseudomonadota bacterium]